MSSNALWFVIRWLQDMAIVNSDDSDNKSRKRMRSGTGQSMATDSGYAGEADGELISSFILQRKLPRKKK